MFSSVLVRLVPLLTSICFAQTPVARHVLANAAGDRYFVVTQDGETWGLLEIFNHHVAEHPLREVHENRGGWGLDLRLRDRRRLTVLVPPARRKATDHPHGYLIHPDRAPERLTEYAADATALARLNIVDRVSVAGADMPARTRAELPVPKDAVVLLVTTPRQDLLKFSERLVEVIARYGLTPLPQARGAYTLILASERDAERALAAIRQAGAFAAVVLDHRTLRAAPGRDEALFTLNAEVDNPLWTLRALVGLSAKPSAQAEVLRAARRGLRTFAEILKTFRGSLPRGRYADAWQGRSFEWARLTTGERLALARQARRLTHLYAQVIDPLADLYVEILKAFKDARDPQAERLLLQTAAPAGPRGFALMSSDAWFAWLNERIDLLAQVPAPTTFEERRDAGWYVDRPNIGLAQLRVQLRLVDAHRTDAREGFAHEIADLPAWPLRQLGYPGDHHLLKQQLLGFLIGADQRIDGVLSIHKTNSIFESMLPIEPKLEVTEAMRAYLGTGALSDGQRVLLAPYGIGPAASSEEFVQRFRRISREAQPDGSAIVQGVLRALRYPPAAPAPDHDFSLDLYHLHAMEIVTDLLNVAADTLRTRGTFASALEIGLQLASLRPGSTLARERQDALNGAITRQLLEFTSRMVHGCAENLKPDVGGLRDWRDNDEALPTN